MDKIIASLLVAFMVLVVTFLGCIVSTLIGALIGWVVGLFFWDTILTFFAGLGIKGLAVWQIGAALGFVGSFFKSTFNAKVGS